mmetsp:Transcript_71757/g.214263  ORF Transcript_71757/g.214263 Transcript_71757/m.214263 type:complete len:283 (-) Transcript_71757:385-1233(-)
MHALPGRAGGGALRGRRAGAGGGGRALEAGAPQPARARRPPAAGARSGRPLAVHAVPGFGRRPPRPAGRGPPPGAARGVAAGGLGLPPDDHRAPGGQPRVCVAGGGDPRVHAPAAPALHLRAGLLEPPLEPPRPPPDAPRLLQAARGQGGPARRRRRGVLGLGHLPRVRLGPSELGDPGIPRGQGRRLLLHAIRAGYGGGRAEEDPAFRQRLRPPRPRADLPDHSRHPAIRASLPRGPAAGRAHRRRPPALPAPAARCLNPRAACMCPCTRVRMRMRRAVFA